MGSDVSPSRLDDSSKSHISRLTHTKQGVFGSYGLINKLSLCNIFCVTAANRFVNLN